MDWKFSRDHVRKRHQVETEWADEALADPEAVRIDPDPASRSGRTVRTIGYSASAADLLTVITVTEGQTTDGVNAWRANDTDRRRYRERPK